MRVSYLFSALLSGSVAAAKEAFAAIWSGRQPFLDFRYTQRPDAPEKSTEPSCVKLQKPGFVDIGDRLLALSFLEPLLALLKLPRLGGDRRSFLFQCTCHDRPFRSR